MQDYYSKNDNNRQVIVIFPLFFLLFQQAAAFPPLPDLCGIRLQSFQKPVAGRQNIFDLFPGCVVIMNPAPSGSASVTAPTWLRSPPVTRHSPLIIAKNAALVY